MDILDNISKGAVTNAHGEMTFFRIDQGSLPSDGWTHFKEFNDNGEFIIGHSEASHHHLLEADGVEVSERTEAGFRILQAIVTKPTALKQDASRPHEAQVIGTGIYLITTAKENPFSQEQASRIAD